MGYFAHDAILAVAWDNAEVDIDGFRNSLPQEWQALVVGPIPAVVNFDEFYVFLPDGSKEGWSTSDDGDEYRRRFVELFKNNEYADIVSVRFGGDFQTEFGKPRVEVLSPAPPKCEDHNPRQHRDAKPPWCPNCGLTKDFQKPVSTFDKR